MTDITTIILTKNEEKNIEAAITSAKQISERILVIDCGSDDKTVELSKQLGAEVYYHEWVGFARQFNWALDHCNIATEWVYRLDADERITEELAKEIEHVTSSNEASEYNAYSMRWQMYFMGKRLRHGGTHRTYVTRLIRFGKARVEDKEMDERFIVEGKTKQLKNYFIHYDYKDLNNWLIKHIRYSDLEIVAYKGTDSRLDSNQQKKRGFYYKLPAFWRARFYYWFRYYIQLGFLDGREGKIFIYLQAYWYRFIVDAKIYERELRQ